MSGHQNMKFINFNILLAYLFSIMWKKGLISFSFALQSFLASDCCSSQLWLIFCFHGICSSLCSPWVICFWDACPKDGCSGGPCLSGICSWDACPQDGCAGGPFLSGICSWDGCPRDGCSNDSCFSGICSSDDCPKYNCLSNSCLSSFTSGCLGDDSSCDCCLIGGSLWSSIFTGLSSSTGVFFSSRMSYGSFCFQ